MTMSNICHAKLGVPACKRNLATWDRQLELYANLALKHLKQLAPNKIGIEDSPEILEKLDLLIYVFIVE